MRPSRPIWFRCFAEVPGVGYVSDAQRRAQLPGRNVVPELIEFGPGQTSLSWRTPDGSGSSPAHSFAFGDNRAEPSDQLRLRVLSALEVPGEPMDYHFVIQGVAEALYKRRRAEPGNLPFVEWLAWFDARLVETHESHFRTSPESDAYFRVFALDFLVNLHEREGYLNEALVLAERFARFGLNGERLDKLRTRVAQLRAEDG